MSGGVNLSLEHNLDPTAEGTLALLPQAQSRNTIDLTKRRTSAIPEDICTDVSDIRQEGQANRPDLSKSPSTIWGVSPPHPSSHLVSAPPCFQKWLLTHRQPSINCPNKTAGDPLYASAPSPPMQDDPTCFVTLRGFDRDGNKAMARVEVILQLHTHREDDGWQSYLNDVEESETTDVIEECIRRHMREKNSRIIIGPDRTRIQSQLDCNDDTFNHAYQRVLREWWERWQEHLNKREPHPTLYVAPLSERAYQSFSAQQLLEWYVRNVDDVESGVRPTSEDRQLLWSISGWNDKQIDTLFRRAHNQLVPRVTQAARGHKDESNGIAEFFKEYLCGTVTQKRKRRKTTLTTQSVRDIMDTIYHSSQWSLDVSQDELLSGICSSYEQSEAETIRRRQRKFGLENRVVITNQDIHAAKMLGRRDSPTLHHIRVYHALEAFIPMRIILRDRLQSGPFLKTGTFIIGSMPYDLFEAFLFRDGTIGDISDQKGWRWIEGKRDETHRYVFKFKQGGFPLLGQAKDCNTPWWERYYRDRNNQITKHYYTEVDFRICSKTFIVWASCTFESRFQDKVLSNAGIERWLPTA
ncbi:hypothetical protein PROFUN_04316 [Planoprotostelium fungivorum]|uniref:Uncharacterized protein n=1 Tax=Planoprotostelium fungivorum TaxID=1890364 RepID=A0A2P6NV43_9EUKA|nr:hypothetical protein PROFUN_04316 [Planoprotostelium fungivorum]